MTADSDTTLVEIGVHGRWSRSLGADVSAAIGKCLAEPPAGIIADLYDLGDPDAASMPLWLAARRAVSAVQPAVQFALCLPTATALNRRLRRTDVVPHVFLFATLAEARAAVTRRLAPVPRRQADMPPHSASAGLARDLVTRAGADWNLPEPLLMRARLVMSELVVNAVEHAGTRIRVTVSHRGADLHLSVHDGTTSRPSLRSAQSSSGTEVLTRPGTRLGIVQAGADAWGSMPARGGKVVWAVVRPRSGDCTAPGL
ncbi:ATP-binding protein [Actinoplanes utahensis]|uniref:ATP-binding protein n=1 Tax=Actinoplanes utahensis TaxID=1869 RepID=UPI00068AD719|nr:ATP-binding protein [Actinoplanes utahensis]